jgi:outer membrane protein assembly factor BamD (BamD/ComL family)
MKKIYIIIPLVLVFFLSCSKKEGTLENLDQQDPSVILQKANELYATGKTKDAFRAYSIIYKKYPTSREYIDAAIGLAHTYNDMGEYEKGMQILLNLVRENIVPSRVPEIYNEMAQYYEDNAGISSAAGVSDEKQDYRKALDFYKKAVKYPNSEDMEAKAFAQYRIGEVHIDLWEFKDAVAAFQETVATYPDTRWAKLAEQRLMEFRQALTNIMGQPEQQAPFLGPEETTPKTEEPDTQAVPEDSVNLKLK